MCAKQKCAVAPIDALQRHWRRRRRRHRSSDAAVVYLFPIAFGAHISYIIYLYFHIKYFFNCFFIYSLVHICYIIYIHTYLLILHFLPQQLDGPMRCSGQIIRLKINKYLPSNIQMWRCARVCACVYVCVRIHIFTYLQVFLIALRHKNEFICICSVFLKHIYLQREKK